MTKVKKMAFGGMGRQVAMPGAKPQPALKGPGMQADLQKLGALRSAMTGQPVAAQKAAADQRASVARGTVAQKAAADLKAAATRGAVAQKAAALKEAAPRAGVKPATGGTPQTVGGVRGVKTIPTAVPRGQAPRAGGTILGGPGKFAKGGATGRASARADGVASKGKTKGRMI